MTIVETPSAAAPQVVPTDSPRPSRLRRAIRPAAILCAAAVLAGCGYQSWLLYQQHRSTLAARAASEAATQYAELLTTANPGTVDRQITELLDRSTGTFHDRYAKQSSELRAMLIANQVTTRGTVIDAAVKSAGATDATVLLFVEQSFSSAVLKKSPGGQVAEAPADVTAMALTLHKDAGRWLVSDVVAGSNSDA
ncbi:hypothetical protein [Mycolicibacter heraklionensis]|uniref:hypothetical protein n=1 Tax=Mycolicibacter heraklionensis TaxID=512402 RepID=UPI0007E977E5|nr:hypothetical protein [Mycolicibacter heraklionensis]OBG40801.1 hypothetical protein A5671_13525 [Mycolicibacter heraklionensis]